MSILAAALLAVALVAAACAPGGEPASIPIALGRGQALVPQMVESLNDAGRTPSVAMTQDGNPAVAYQLVKSPPEPGEVPAAIIPGQPQPPAVVLATFAEGAWNKAPITPQPGGKTPEDVAKQIAGKDAEALPGVNVGLAVDEQGGSHVVWSSPSGVFYSTGSPGNFGEPEQIVKDQTLGASVTVAADGSPWVSYYAGNAVMAATLSGETWKVEEVATAGGGAGDAPVRTSIKVGADGEPAVAYTDLAKSAPMVARRKGGSWTPEPIKGGEGGFGISLALDNDGNPHTAYYTENGGVEHAHQVGGGTWEVTELATSGTASLEEDGTGSSAGIALDEKGVHYVTWADTRVRQIMLATNAEGDFAPQAVTGSTGGVSPSIAVSPDGASLALAWYDSVDANLAVATPASEGFVLAQTSPQATTAPTAVVPSPGGEPACEPEGETVKVVAQNLAFDTDCLAAPAGNPFTITFENKDAGVPHNVAIYRDETFTESLFTGDTFPGVETVEYKVPALEDGNYFFRCDVHPQTMTGQFAAVAQQGG